MPCHAVALFMTCHATPLPGCRPVCLPACTQRCQFYGINLGVGLSVAIPGFASQIAHGMLGEPRARSPLTACSTSAPATP